MSRLFFIVAVVLFSGSAHAVNVSVQNTCNEFRWLDADIALVGEQTVGDLTISAFDSNSLPYIGTTAGINSIRATPVGSEAIEVISGTHMRAYGWCYEINGVSPDQMPDQIKVTSNDEQINWYFGFAEFKDGEWVSYCTPTHTVRPKFICP